jgi:hypothetical protein
MENKKGKIESQENNIYFLCKSNNRIMSRGEKEDMVLVVW